ncbi:MAG: YMGG-like glycine zipper-containing protein [Gemmatimonadaceae bacterium]
MRKYIRPFAAPLALALLIAAGACKGKDNTLALDTALPSDLELAGADTAVQPGLNDVPAPTASQPAPVATPRPNNPPRSAPRTPRRTTTPAAPAGPSKTTSGNTVATGATGSEGRLATIGAGTTINLTSGSRVCTNTHKAGDKFTATVSAAVVGSNGAVIPAGATAVVQVTSVKRSENANDPAQIGLVVQTISFGGKSYPVDATITSAAVDRTRESGTKDDAKKVVGGAVVGAIIGQILGKDTKSTVIGAATGAAAGTAVAVGTADYAGCIPSGGRIAIKLNSAATIQAE